MTRSLVFCSFVISFLLASSSHAAPIGFALSGTISEVNDLGNIFGGQFAVGMPFTGMISYDPATLTDSNPDPATGRYEDDPIQGQIELTMQVAGESFSTNPLEFGVGLVLDNGPAGDRFSLNTNPNQISSSIPINSIEMVLLSSSNSVLSDDSLPTTLDLADWDQTRYLAFSSVSFPDIGIVFGEIASITAIPAPEPGTGILIALGTGLAALRRRPGRSARLSS